MRIFVELRDNEDRLHRDFEWTFKDNGSITELKDIIKEKYLIDHHNQELWFNGSKIRTETATEAGMKNGDTCILKHSALDDWKKFISNCKIVNDPKALREERKSSAYMAIRLSQLLQDSALVSAYIHFHDEWIEKRGQAMRFIDRIQPAFKAGAIDFFEKYQPGSSIVFEAKKTGIMAGMIATVKKDGLEARYFLKTYHKSGTSKVMSANHRFPPDFLEILVYRILNMLNFGPMPFFPFYSKSIFIYFIMTREVDGFQVVEQLKDEELKSRIVVEMYVIRLILFISDLHGENFGVDKEKRLSIVDFCPPMGEIFSRRDIVNDFKTGNKMDNFEINEILKTVETERRIKIGREILDRLSGIREITANLINDEKEMLRNHGIKFSNGTPDIEKYIKDIKENFEKLREGLQ